MEHGKILLVEDDRDVREALAAYLTCEGYDVVEAGDGREALQHLNAGTYCLILLDVMMPVMNGWDFRREQLKHPQLADIPVVLVTADTSAASRAAEIGAAGCLVKPVELGELLEQVERNC